MLPATCALVLAVSAASSRPTASPPVRVADVRLEDLVRFSDVVVLGRIERVERVAQEPAHTDEDRFDRLPDEVPVALVRVSRVLKGPPGLELVQYVAASRWTCDTTTANLDEEALLFLGDASADKLLEAKLRSDIRALLPRGELMDLMWSGRGRMPLESGKVTYWTDVVMPKDCPDVDGPDPTSASFIRSVAVEWIADRVLRIVEAQKQPWIRASVSEVSGGAVGWELELAMDRHGHCVIHAPDGDRTRALVADWKSAVGIDRALSAWQRTPPPETIGSGIPALGVRHLEILGGPIARKVRILSIESDWTEDPSREKAASAALAAWAELRGLIDDPKCADHRASDLPLLK